VLRRLSGWALATLLLVASSAYSAEDVVEQGRKHATDFLDGRLDAMWNAMTPDMQRAIGNVADLRRFHRDVEGQFGPETNVLSERLDEQDGFEIYLRTSTYGKSDIPIILQLAFDSNDRIAGFFIRPVQEPAKSRFLEYRTKSRLHLPFEGDWFVYWGGRTPETNYHVVDRAQRFAYDFVIMHDGASHRGEGAAVQDYFCWDEPIRAPAAGEIVSVVDTLPDQKIGRTDARNPAGNHVVLKLAEEEYAFLAHMRQGSIMVTAGEKVSRGDELGRCGNSGNTSEPHLHFHLQTTPELATGEGLPAFFLDYVADDARIPVGEPQRGEIIRPARGE